MDPPPVTWRAPLCGSSRGAQVLTHLMDAGLLCRVACVYAEGRHLGPKWPAQARERLAREGCATELILLDDEKGDDRLPLPSAESVAAAGTGGLAAARGVQAAAGGPAAAAAKAPPPAPSPPIKRS